jgi:hypothetical protein
MRVLNRRSFAREALVMGLVMSSGCQENAADPVATPSSGIAPAAPETAPAPPTGELAASPGPDLLAVPAGESLPAAGATELAGGLEARRSAITTSEVTINSASDAWMAESASAVMTGPDGTPQTVVASNVIGSSGGELARADFGCIRGSSAQCQYSLNIGGAGSDPSLVVGGDGFMYEQRLASGGGLWLRNNNPCPSGCTSGGLAWSTCSSGFSIDWSMAAFADSSGHVWGVHNDFTDDIFDAIAVNRLTWCSSVSWWSRAAQCHTQGGSKNKRDPHAALGGNNILHVVYANVTDQVVEHTTFNMSTMTWSCTNDVIGSIVLPSTPSCGASTTHVMPAIGNSNLEYDFAPRIARDPVSGFMVVTWDSFDSSVNKVRGRAFMSSNGGSAWTWTLLTGDETGKSAVAAGSGSSFEIGETYKDFVTPSNKVAQVRWLSTDGGAHWAGSVISSFRTISPVNVSARPCFWGDYDPISFHSANSAFFHSWYDSSLGPRSVVRGRFFQN